MSFCINQVLCNVCPHHFKEMNSSPYFIHQGTACSDTASASQQVITNLEESMAEKKTQFSSSQERSANKQAELGETERVLREVRGGG
jgi:hypothetical protein